MNDFLLIIDGSSLLTTSYYGILPPSLKNSKLSNADQEIYYQDILQTRDGLFTNAIYGFMKTLLSILENQQPKYIVVNWDASRDTFRRQIYSDYKGNRKETPRPLKEQEETIRKLLKFIGIKQYMSNTYEADDFSGTLANRFKNETYIRILTKDRDHLQLVDDKVNIWLTFPMDKDGISPQVDKLNTQFGINGASLKVPSNVFRITKDLVKPYYGVNANHVIEFKALMGDAADNIPGVNGIGEKTAIILLERFGSLFNLYDFIEFNPEETVLDEFKNIHIRGCKKVLEALINGQTDAIMSKTLATIKCDVPIGDIPLSFFETNINKDNLKASLERLQFKKLLEQYF